MAFRIGNTPRNSCWRFTPRAISVSSDLGVYGLIVGGTILTPAILGLGTSDWVVRQIVTMSRADALAAMTTRLALPVVMHAVAQPRCGFSMSRSDRRCHGRWCAASGLILFLEHVANDASDLLIARGRALFASVHCCSCELASGRFPVIAGVFSIRVRGH